MVVHARCRGQRATLIYLPTQIPSHSVLPSAWVNATMVGRPKQKRTPTSSSSCFRREKLPFSCASSVLQMSQRDKKLKLYLTFCTPLLTLLTHFVSCSSKTDMHSNGHTAVSFAKQELPKLLQLGNKSNRTTASSNSHTRRDGKDACTGQ